MAPRSKGAQGKKSKMIATANPRQVHLRQPPRLRTQVACPPSLVYSPRMQGVARQQCGPGRAAATARGCPAGFPKFFARVANAWTTPAETAQRPVRCADNQHDGDLMIGGHGSNSPITTVWVIPDRSPVKAPVTSC